ncbi:MAG: hypothetical protein ACO2O1_08800 [Candidatus Caldarchaeales archaeon]
MCEEVPRQKAAESRKIPESGSVIPREGVERSMKASLVLVFGADGDPERGS